jgi:hypothetical protein
MIFRRHFNRSDGVGLAMRIFAVILVLALAVTGCTTRSQARKEAQRAFLAGQSATLQRELAEQADSVTVIGPVQNSLVPWVAGLTLAQAVATANYVGEHNPREIIITRNGEQASLDASALLNGAKVPLEPGDVVEIH